MGRVVEEQSNVSFDSRVHLWPRESARCKISPVKAEVAPLEHNCKNNDSFQTRFKKNLPPFSVTSVYVCYTSQNTCKNEQKTTGSLLRTVLLGHIPFLNPSNMFRQFETWSRHFVVLHKTQHLPYRDLITRKGVHFAIRNHKAYTEELPRDIALFNGIWQIW